MSEDDLRELTRVWSLPEADIIQSFLESQGIPCLLRGQVPPRVSVYVLTTDGMGEIRILVREKDLETAQQLLAELPPETQKKPL